MAMSIHNNMSALFNSRQSSMNNIKLQSAMAKLASGYRINSAADDPAGLGISEMMRAQQTGLERAISNAMDGSSLVQTAEGALSEVNSMLNRLTDLATQAANGTLNKSQRATINNEAQDILKEINRISQATNFNGIKVLDGSLSNTATKPGVQGVQMQQQAATAGSVDFAAMPGVNNLSAGQEISFSLGTNQGSTGMSFRVSDDLSSLVATDGRSYSITAADNGDATVNVSGEDIARALSGEMKAAGLSESFDIQQSGDALKLTSKEAGADARQVNHLACSVDGTPVSNVSATVIKGADATSKISADSFTNFKGSNAAEATFTVNSKSFALVHETNFDQTAKKLPEGVTAIKVQGGLGNALTGQDLRAIASTVNREAGTQFQAAQDGIELRGEAGKALNLQVGDTADAHNSVQVDIANMSVQGLGLSGLDLSTQDGASAALKSISNAREQVSSVRGNLGAMQNRLESTIQNLGVTNENITAAESRIRDVDMAKMFMEYTKRNILSQVSMAMQAQANLQSQQVMQLLR